MKKALTVLLLVTIVLATAFANGGNENVKSGSKEKQYKETVLIATSGLLSSIDIHDNTKSINMLSYRITHNTLVYTDHETGNIIPEIATSWTVSDDGLSYTFKLRDDVYFHEGQHMTAKDVKYSMDRAKKTPSQKTRTKNWASWTVLDDYTIVLKNKVTDPETLDTLTAPNLGIICEETGEGTDKWGLQNGTGPYHLKEWLPGNYALYETFDKYFGDQTPTKFIKFQLFGEASARVIELETGDVDFCVDVPTIEAENLKNYGCELIQLRSVQVKYLALNMQREIFKDKRVRQAFRYATDQETVILLQKEGRAFTNNGIAPSGVKFSSDATLKKYEYNPEKAKALLKEAGYPNGISVQFQYDNGTDPNLFETLQAMWAKAGINLILSTSDATVASDNRKAGKFDIDTCQQSFSQTSASLFAIAHSTSANNKALWKDATVDKYIDEAGVTVDEAKRGELFMKCIEYIQEEGPFIPLFVTENLYGKRAGVSGEDLYSTQRHNFRNIVATY